MWGSGGLAPLIFNLNTRRGDWSAITVVSYRKNHSMRIGWAAGPVWLLLEKQIYIYIYIVLLQRNTIAQLLC